jgi:hypothetical protein
MQPDLLVQSEIAVNRSNGSYGVLVNQDIPLNLHQYREVVE